MSDRLWYYVNGTEQAGPVSETDLRAWLATNALARETLVWSEGMAEWVLASATALVGAPAAAAGPSPLAPSEVVLLCADQFAGKAGALGNGNFDLLHREGSVSYQELGLALYPIVMLACEQAGVLQLTQTQKKALLGLRTVDTLMAQATGAPCPFPEGSLEARLLGLLAKGPMEVEQLFYTLLGQDTNNPWAQSVDMVPAGLKQRGLVTAEAYKAMKIFTMYRYKATPELLALAAAQDTTPLRGLLTACQQGRPAIYKLLVDAFKKTISRRTESDDADFD